MSKAVKKKVNFINSSRNEGLSPSCTALSFDGFGSISWHSIWVFGSFTLFTIFSGFPTFLANLNLSYTDDKAFPRTPFHYCTTL